MKHDVLNISAYRFVELEKPATLSHVLYDRAAALGLKGTVLLAAEGINLVLAGPPAPLRTWLFELQSDVRFADLQIKESWSESVPFGKLRVKVKPEIIRMNRPTVRPQSQRAPGVDAPTLARWLDRGSDDAGRPVRLLDTRNGFEVDHGRFRNTLDWRLERFSDFPEKLAEQRESLRGSTIVSYCTGGIRCEKAALYMQQAGIEDVLQLEGGVLRYLELTDGRHFEGSCFVFDERVALDSALAASTGI